MITLAISNQKGGAGKTTLARNILFYAVERGLRVLAVDFDPQANFTKTMLGMYDGEAPFSEIDYMNASDLFQTACTKLPAKCGQASLLSADRDLIYVAQKPLEDLYNPRDMLKGLSANYDLCVIDTAPTVGMPLYAALIASNYVICPTIMDQDSIDGVVALSKEVNVVRSSGMNADLEVAGIVANRVNTRRSYDINALKALRSDWGDLIFDSTLFDRAATQYAKDRPVWRVQSGESQILAAKEMKALCAELFHKIGLKG